MKRESPFWEGARDPKKPFVPAEEIPDIDRLSPEEIAKLKDIALKKGWKALSENEQDALAGALEEQGQAIRISGGREDGADNIQEGVDDFEETSTGVARELPFSENNLPIMSNELDDAEVAQSHRLTLEARSKLRGTGKELRQGHGHRGKKQSLPKESRETPRKSASGG